jgi:Uma2 family endonuclease
MDVYWSPVDFWRAEVIAVSLATTKGVTAQEFLDFVQRPENRGRFFELERGEIIEMPPPNKSHVVEEDPDTVRGPDLSYFNDVQSFEEIERGYAATPPLLAVEVLLPHDRLTRMSVRVAQLMSRGVELVWVVDAEAREVCVHRRGRDPYIVTAEKELTGDNVLPGFACRVAEFFSLPGQAPAVQGPK